MSEIFLIESTSGYNGIHEISSPEEEVLGSSSEQQVEAFSAELLENKTSSRELQAAHTRNFVARHCQTHPQVMAAFDRAMATWMFGHERILGAVMFAAEKHAGQTRKDLEKTPYLIHPLGVAQLTFELGGICDPDTLIAALLHDTIEDTDATSEEIEAAFGSRVLQLVLDLTNAPDGSKAQQTAHAPQMDFHAKVVKLADRYYNICDLENATWDQKRTDQYILWGAKLCQVLRGTCRNLEKAIDDKVTTHFQERYSTKEVEKLSAAWQFPSDHLPVGARVDDMEIASWNVLNTCYLSWVTEKDTQGLNGSLITTANQVVNLETGLTERDRLVIDRILGMIQHPTHPKQLISLQECSPEFLEALSEALPDFMNIAYSSEKPFPRNQDVVIYDSRVLTLKSQNCDFPYHLSGPERPVQNLLFAKGEQTYRVINGHLPGDPSLPGRQDFAAYVNQQSDDVVIAMGDMNFTREEMHNAFLEQGGEAASFALIPAYPTNIGLDLRSKGIDHIVVRGTFDWDTRNPEETQVGLTSTLALLT
ncbi:MAG: HD domain-containing protein [Chlamydiia bacterium]|nr:HD domain-containing protein [Chlamydiia bacterium]